MEVTSRSHFRGDIEGLRAIAVGLVVAFHAGAGLVPGGYVGVDVFFVLSGFLITGLLLDELRRTGRISLRNFYARRIRRLLPLSTLVLLVTAVAAALLLPPIDHAGVAGDVRSTALYAANWHFAAGSVQYMSDVDKSPLLHYWSLSVEEQYYVIWPLLLVLVAGGSAVADRGRRAIRLQHTVYRRIAIVLGVLVLSSLALSVWLTSTSGPFAYFGLHTRAWELGVGAALAVGAGVTARLQRRPAVLLGWVGLALVVTSALVFDAETPFPGTAAVLPVAGTALLIAGGAAQAGGASRFLANPVLRYVGRISYAWYLWHWPCLVLVGGIGAGAALEADESASGSALPLVLGAVGLSFILAVVSHHALEQPVRRSKWLSSVRGRSLGLGVALTVLSVAGGMLTLAGDEEPGPGGAGAAAAPVFTPGTDKAMTAAQARADRPEGLQGCYNAFPDDAVRPTCVFGHPGGSRRIALIGDSHAAQWFPGVQALASSRGWTMYFWAKASCPLVGADIWLSAYKAPFSECSRWRRSVLEQLHTLPRLDAVVVVRGRNYDDGVAAPDGHRVSGEELEFQWRESFSAGLEGLTAVSPKVVLLRPTLWPGTDVPRCLSKNPSTPHVCDFSRQRAEAFGGALDAAEATVLASKKVATVLDLTPSVCPGDPCPVVAADGTVIYRDNQHFTATFSRSLAGPLRTALVPIVEGPSAGATQKSH